VHQETVVPLVGKVMDGFNATVLAYGQTCSGKTYTMGSSDSSFAAADDDPSLGIIPRTLGDIFRAKQEKESQGVRAVVYCRCNHRLRWGRGRGRGRGAAVAAGGPVSGESS
jgi:hypothetical protein